MFWFFNFLRSASVSRQPPQLYRVFAELPVATRPLRKGKVTFMCALHVLKAVDLRIPLGQLPLERSYERVLGYERILWDEQRAKFSKHFITDIGELTGRL